MAGLVDVSNADEALATRIVEVHAQLNDLSSVHDLGSVLDLDGHAVERLRKRVLFLPR